MENCKLLYLPTESFLNLFEHAELLKLREFMEYVDLKAIENKIKSTWKYKKMVQKQVMSAATEDNKPDKQHRIAPWIKKVKSKYTTSPEIGIEESRIKILSVKEVSAPI